MPPPPSTLLAVGGLVENRHRVIRWLGASKLYSIVQVRDVRAGSQPLAIRALVTVHADATEETRRAFREASMRELALGRQGEGSFDLVEIDTIVSDGRAFVIADMSRADLESLLAGRRQIGGQ